MTLSFTAIPGVPSAILSSTTASAPADPTEFNASMYTAPLAISATTMIKARAFHVDYQQSAVLQRDLHMAVATPTLTPGGGTYAAGQTITVATATPGATINYTLNGAEPTSTDPVIASGGTLVAGNFTLKVKATKTGSTPSATATGTYAITGSVTSYLVAMGERHALAARPDGTMFAWGDNDSMVLGIGNTTADQWIAMPVQALTGAVSIAGGQSHSFAVRSTGDVVAWGSNGQGELGIGTTQTPPVPVIVPGLTDAVAIAKGGTHTLVAKADQTVVAWGQNGFGQLGTGTTGGPYAIAPVAVTGVTGVTAVAAGNRHSLALKSDHTVWAWGDRAEGAIGHGAASGTAPAPVHVTGVTDVVAIAAGRFHSFAVRDDGSLWAWGNNFWGQLGNNGKTTSTIPVEITGITDVIAVAGGSAHSIALKSDGTVWTWGSNSGGALGQAGAYTERLVPTQVPGLSSIIAIAAGPSSCLVVSTDGSVWSWGNNSEGMLGDGTTTVRAVAGADRRPRHALEGAHAHGDADVERLPHRSEHHRHGAGSRDDAALHADRRRSHDGRFDGDVGRDGGDHAERDAEGRGLQDGRAAELLVTNTYELKTVTPTISPGTGTYGTPPSVTLATTTPSATIRYTLDSSDPDVELADLHGAVDASPARRR